MEAVEARVFWGKNLRDVHHLVTPATLPALSALRCEDGRYVVRQRDREFALRPGVIAIVHEDELTFALKLVSVAKLEKTPLSVDFTFLNLLIVVAFLMAGWVTAMSLYPEEGVLDELALIQQPVFFQNVLQRETKPEPISATATKAGATSAPGKPRRAPAPKVFDPRKVGVFAALHGGAMSQVFASDSTEVNQALEDLRAPTAAALGRLDARSTAPGGTDQETIGIGPPRTRGRLPGDGHYGDDKVTLGKHVETEVVMEDRPPVTTGALPPELIAQVMKENRNAFRYCYEHALQAHHDLAGMVKLQFVIGADGRVNTAIVKDATLTEPEVQTCLLQKVRALQFPKPRGGGIVLVSYPFVFRAH